MTRPKEHRKGGKITRKGSTNRRILPSRTRWRDGKRQVYHATKGWRFE